MRSRKRIFLQRIDTDDDESAIIEETQRVFENARTKSMGVWFMHEATIRPITMMRAASATSSIVWPKAVDEADLRGGNGHEPD